MMFVMTVCLMVIAVAALSIAFLNAVFNRLSLFARELLLTVLVFDIIHIDVSDPLFSLLSRACSVMLDGVEVVAF